MPLFDCQATPDRLSWSLVALLACGHCAAFADRGLPAVVAPLLKADLGLSDTQLGLLDGPAFAVLYAVGMLATLPLASSRHRFRLLAGCIGLWVMGMVGFALAPSFGALVAARAVVGVGQSAYVPLALGLIVERAAPHWRARSIAAFTAGAVVGRGLALLLGGLALALLARWLPAWGGTHWRLLFLVMAVPNLVLIAVLLRCAERPPLASAPAASLRQMLAWLRQQPALMALYLGCAGASVLVVQTVGAWAPSVLNREQGLTPAMAAFAFGGSVLIASPMGHLLAGALVDMRRRQVMPTWVVAVGLLLAVPLLWAVTSSASAVAACGYLALASLTGGTAAVAALAGLPPLLPPALRDAGVRLFLVFITVVGVGLGPFFAGLVSDELGMGGRGLSIALWRVCLTAAALGLMAALLVGGRWRRVVAETKS